MPHANDLVSVKTTPEEMKRWWSRIRAARNERDRHSRSWDILLEEYKPVVAASGDPENVKANIHFRNVEQKKSQLFFRSPEMRLHPTERMDAAVKGPDGQPLSTGDGRAVTEDSAVTVHEQVLNYYLSPHKLGLSLLMDRVLFDCLCPSGLMATKIGYRAYTETVDQPVMEQVLQYPGGSIGRALGATPQVVEQPVFDEQGNPVTEQVPVVVKDEYFWSRIPPKRLLIPADYKDTDFDKAPWLAVEFRMPFREGKRQFRLSREFEPKKSPNDDLLVGVDVGNEESSETFIKGVEIWYKGYLYRDEIVNPDAYFQLILIEGEDDARGADKPAVHRMSPYQDIDPTTRRLTHQSMLGNPIHVGTVRDLTDNAYVPSDCAMTNSEAKEVNTYRRQTVKLRDANLPRFFYDTERVTPETLSALRSTDIGQFIPVEGQSLDGGIEKLVAQVTQGSQSRVDSDGVFRLEQDIEKALAIGANQAGGETSTVRTATELSLIQANTNARLKKEQDRVLLYVTSGIAKFDSLLQMFADHDELISIVGEDGIRRLETWNKDTLAGRFAYEIVPDSQLAIDMATERSQMTQFYNLTGQDPFNNRKESLKKLQKSFGIDPAKATIDPPPEPPTVPTIKLDIKGEDFVGPQAPIILELLAKSGIELSSESAQLVEQLSQLMPQAENGQPEHGGPVDKIPAIDKGSGDTTGQLDGGGSGTGRVV